jgi:UDP-N-acetylglucosamine--dolichyl-phosphate N-acetylglucosaminephosphotransferase
MYLLFFIISFIVSLPAFPLMIPALKRSRITGKDRHKPGQPEIAEMGGLIIILGFGAAIVLAISIKTFSQRLSSVDLDTIMAVFATVLVAAIIGVLDDLVSLNKWVKAIAPVFAAFPLMAIKAGVTTMTVPFVGLVDFGIIYTLVLIPLGITATANVVNMLAGFNGLEAGMGAVAMTGLAGIAFRHGANTSLVILLAALGPLIATLRYNWFPARIFVGDVGTLSIGIIIASAVIVGNFEFAGVIIMIPYVMEFIIKAWNHFPSQGWWGTVKDGKLYCPESEFVGLGQLVMKLSRGIKEQHLSLVLMGFEGVCAALAVWMFW